jgi:acetyl-CoA C-acetyltransferase
MAGSIVDKVAIIGMGCTRFGEFWDKGADDLLVEAAYEAIEDAGIEPKDIEAYWFGTMFGVSSLPMALALKSQYKPVTRIENLCGTGTDAFRNACYAVASGAYDMAMAIGVEKLKDSGLSGLDISDITYRPDGTAPDITAPAAFSFLAPAYFKRYGLDSKKGKEVLARIAWKNHKNGALNPKAQYRKEVPMEQILKSPMIAAPLGIMDCSGICDGSAAVIIVRAEDAKKYRSDPVYVKGLAVSTGPEAGGLYPDYDFTTLRETYFAGQDAYRQARIKNPREEVSMAEVHDCFTPTELIVYEDLGFSERGKAWQDVLNGFFDLDGPLPVNPDGGLKSFGHPIGASGIRMLYEMYKQLQGKAGPRQIKNPKVGMTHNIGGMPWKAVTAVTIIGKELG